jgi:23S rRNA (uracil1939-C5)-methyltransferase
LEDKPDHLRARVAEVLDPSPARVAEPCEFARAGCGGCTWQHINAGYQVDLKVGIVQDALTRIARIEQPPFTDPVVLPATGYRTAVRVAVSDGRAAFRRLHSHERIEIDTCLVAHPLVEEILRDGRFAGAREAVVRVGARTGERCVVTDPPRTRIEVPSDVALGARAAIHEIIDGRLLRISAQSFFQARPDGADALVRLVRAAVGPDRVVADLYAGVGLFAAFVDSPRSIVAVESSRAALADAKHNLRDLPARVVRADVRRWHVEPVDVVIADPPRTGLRRSGVETVTNCEPKRVVLVSCDAAALARDVALFGSAGYDLTAVTLVDLFPHTPHVECVSVLDRA